MSINHYNRLNKTSVETRKKTLRGSFFLKYTVIKYRINNSKLFRIQKVYLESEQKSNKV